jgi:tryptophanyl-tRNA synthetase
MFVVPEAYILRETAKILDLQDPITKMGKTNASTAGVIELLDDPAVNVRKVRSAVTDSEREIRFDPERKPGVSNLLTIYSALTGRTIADLTAAYAGKGYGDLKKDLADVVVDFASPFRSRTLELLRDRAELEKLLARGAERARDHASVTLRKAYASVGFALGR